MHPFKTMAAAAIAASTLTFSGQGNAQTVEDVYILYHSAISVADLCKDYQFEMHGTDDPDQEWIGQAQANMGAYIDAVVNNQVSAGDRLHLIERAKGEADAYIHEHGCDDPLAQERLALFEAELEPLLPPR
ncbi:MAG: hypothetical protein WD044_06565 [Dongiaceae bacterium]